LKRKDDEAVEEKKGKEKADWTIVTGKGKRRKGEDDVDVSKSQPQNQTSTGFKPFSLNAQAGNRA